MHGVLSDIPLYHNIKNYLQRVQQIVCPWRREVVKYLVVPALEQLLCICMGMVVVAYVVVW